jgi:hypothetical protein
MCHAGASSPVQSVRSDTCVDAVMMKGLDLYGSSCDASWESQAYVTDATKVRGLENKSQLTRVRIQVDWLRSLSPRSWICELYANFYHPWATRQPAMLLWQFWQALSRGLGGIMIWEYKVERIGIESLGYGLLGLDGKPNDRSRALSAAMRLVQKDLVEFFQEFAFQEPTVGILYDERSHLLSEMDGFYNSQWSDIYIRSLWALYETLRRKNIPVRLVPHQHLDSVLPSLKTFFLPGHGYMDAALAATLRRFVENGGHLIGQAGVGFRKENTWVSTVIPSHNLDKLFDVTERTRTFMDQLFPLLDSRRRVIDKLHGFKIDLECHDATAKAKFQDGAVALAAHPFGRGRTHYLGGFLGMGNAGAGSLLDQLGVTLPPDDPLSRFADLKLDCIPWQRKTDGGQAYFLFNTSPKPVTFARPFTSLKRTTVLFGVNKSRNHKLQLAPNSGILLW